MRRALICLAMCSLLAPRAALAGVEKAEQLASESLKLISTDPARALEVARQALQESRDFDPTTFVKPGRKGEVFEDAFLAARSRYRAHRARVYSAVGQALLALGRPEAASRYLGRAALLDPPAAPTAALASALATTGRGWEALDLLLATPNLAADRVAVAQRVADQLRLPSLQAEIDARRLKQLGIKGIEARRGPIRFPQGTRLSTGARLHLDPTQPLLVYVPETSCRTCSEDFQVLAHVEPPVLLLRPEGSGQQALREILRVYGFHWDYLLGVGVDVFKVEGPAVVVLGREGWSNAVVHPPLDRALPAVLDVMNRHEVRERLPRAAWNGREPQAPPPVTPPALLDDGLAPGESEPAVPEFVTAREAFDAGRFAEAAKLFAALAGDEDGWMLPPEARYDRALCLAGMGRRDEARRELLKIGDSRFQDAVDAALERVAAQ